MTDPLQRATVLVLNRHWQAINTATPAQAFCHMAADTATALAVETGPGGTATALTPVRWVDWLRLPVRPGDAAVRTARGPVRVPTVLVLANFARVPHTRPKLTARGIRQRDGHRCQYTGRRLGPGEGNIDHVVPLSRGGRTTWENCVLADRAVNSRKADRLPEEAGLKLIRPPAAPRPVPVTMAIRNLHAVPDWDHFLVPHA